MASATVNIIRVAIIQYACSLDWDNRHIDVSYEISGSLKIYFYILHQPCIQRFEPWMLSFSDILAFVPVSGPTWTLAIKHNT